MKQSFKPVRRDIRAAWLPNARNLGSMGSVCSITRIGHGRSKFLFRIGSIDDKILSYWNPGAPKFEKILEFLKTIHSLGHATAMVINPADYRTLELVEAVRPYITESIMIVSGRPTSRLAPQGDPADIEARLYQLGIIQSRQNIASLRVRLGNDPLIRWQGK